MGRDTRDRCDRVATSTATGKDRKLERQAPRAARSSKSSSCFAPDWLRLEPCRDRTDANRPDTPARVACALSLEDARHRRAGGIPADDAGPGRGCANLQWRNKTGERRRARTRAGPRPTGGGRLNIDGWVDGRLLAAAGTGISACHR